MQNISNINIILLRTSIIAPTHTGWKSDGVVYRGRQSPPLMLLHSSAPPHGALYLPMEVCLAAATAAPAPAAPTYAPPSRRAHSRAHSRRWSHGAAIAGFPVMGQASQPFFASGRHFLAPSFTLLGSCISMAGGLSSGPGIALALETERPGKYLGVRWVGGLRGSDAHEVCGKARPSSSKGREPPPPHDGIGPLAVGMLLLAAGRPPTSEARNSHACGLSPIST